MRLHEKLREFSTKCDSQGNLPEKYSGEFLKLMTDLITQINQSNCEIERLENAFKETEAQINELTVKNDEIMIIVDFIGDFLKDRDLTDDFSAFFEQKINSLNEVPLN